ncbi:amino acid adenylation domain-containing protein, partial [Microbulbifer sp. TYP-18]|uniref:amino acid adenylation domain-containing protein n=1 Tax=Microbulbifer sp. TYP-18 TaxID=3230024 RepID=UPI0034C629F7
LRLTGQALPEAFVALEGLPREASGRLDRRALPEPERELTAFAAPEGETETLLAAFWSELIGRQPVGRHDVFFEVGGYSLLASQLAARIREAFRVDIPVRELFAHTTVQAQAALIDTRRANTGAGEALVLPALIPVSRDEPLPLSYAQQRLWFLGRYMGPNPVYNIPLAVRLRGDVELALLKQSLAHLIQRHESLRTRFAYDGRQAVQVIDEEVPALSLEVVRSTAEVQSISQAEWMHPFDVTAERLSRFRLLCDERDGSHLLLITLHHSIADGWSLGILFRELVSVYRDLKAGRSPTLPPLSVQYADYAQWQRRCLEGETLTRQLAYWKTQLRDLPTRLTLPTDRPRPAEQSFHGAYASLSIPLEQTQRIKALAGAQGVTLFMTLISVFAVLLARYSGQRDLAIGTPMANRHLPATESLIGFFINSVVLRFDLERDPSFIELLRTTRETTLDAHAHQDIPFERLVDELNPERSVSYSPLFQVSFSLVNTPVDDVALDELALSCESMADDQEGISRYDITFNLSETETGLRGGMEYNTDLFDRVTIERMLDHYQRLLSAAVASPALPVSHLELLSGEERRQQLELWNDNGAAFPAQTLHGLLEVQAQARPDAVALVCQDQQLTYGELDRRANQIAHYLLDRGLKPEQCVGVCTERSIELVAGLLGILKAGGCYVPLDPEYPPARLEAMMAHCACSMVLTEQHLLEELEFLSEVRILLLDAELYPMTLGKYPGDNLPAHMASVSPGHLAYITYTSGSTGKPKGVCITHGNILSLVGAGHRLAADAGQVVGQFSNYVFDAITYELWGALAAGARAVMVAREQTLELPQLEDVILRQRIDIAFFTTALFNRVSLTIPGCLKRLQKLLFGGEAFSAEAIDGALRALPGELHHVYGPTECTTFATVHTIEPAVFAQTQTAPIGRALANNTGFVLHDNSSLAPVGVVGELCIGGAGLSRGYLKHPRLTAEKFVPNPYAQTPGERLYCSGDLARALPDGELEFIGRVDTQVKVRGFRIELGEIENHLLQHERVEEVVVLARDNPLGAKSLVAYLVLDRDAIDDEWHQLQLRLMEYLQERLPDYMVPSAFVRLPAIPLTPNRKVDQRALPAPADQDFARSRYQAPSSDMEVTLVALWQENLKVEKIGIEDNYFSLGGDSIRSISLVAEAKERGLVFSVKDLFSNPTVAALASVITKMSDEKNNEPDLSEPWQELDTFSMLTEEEKLSLLNNFSVEAEDKS